MTGCGRMVCRRALCWLMPSIALRYEHPYERKCSYETLSCALEILLVGVDTAYEHTCERERSYGTPSYALERGSLWPPGHTTARTSVSARTTGRLSLWSSCCSQPRAHTSAHTTGAVIWHAVLSPGAAELHEICVLPPHVRHIAFLQ